MPASKSAKPAKPAKSATKPAKETKVSKGTKVGVVDSDTRAKTRRVVVSYMAKHPKYGKYLGQRTILHVHDENSESHTGDVVEVAPCRPVSKSKNWRLVRIVERRADVAAAVKSAKEVQ